MQDITFDEFQVKKYRSLMDITIRMSSSDPVVICGENNIGKTNFLRALNIFFNFFRDDSLFEQKFDTPNHLYEGQQIRQWKTEFLGQFSIKGKKTSIKLTFKNDTEPCYELDGKENSHEKAIAYLENFKFILIESHNVHLPSLISEALEEDGLTQLDNKRGKQQRPMDKLREFIQLSKAAIADIEKDINQCFEKFTDFDGILQGKKIKITIAEFEKLKDAIKTMTSITIHDGNSHGIASKGSGAQRAVFLSLMQYISKMSKKKIIWGLDEPEAFLQPNLQKKVFNVICNIVKEQHQLAVITTHSQHFIDLNNLKTTHLFKGVQEQRTYAKRPGVIFYETNTENIKTESHLQKCVLIKKHLGITNNDSWTVLPYNILVEGEEDKKYLEILFTSFDIPQPNIIWSGGASKVGGFLQYYNIFAKDLGFKPIFKCIFDNDQEGREQSSKIKPKSYANLDVSIIPLIRHDNANHEMCRDDWEIEDFFSPDVILKSINVILKKEGYDSITPQQITNKTMPANIGKQILKYAEECSNQRNPEKSPLLLDHEGRKKQLCTIFFERHSKGLDIETLKNYQVNFIKSLATA